MFDNALRARDLVKQRLPDLRVGPGKTKNSALHHLVFAGTLEEHMWRACRNHAWGPRILALQSTGRPKTYIPTRELVAVGDEHGLQGRFDQHVGQVMSGILESEGMDLVFGDFKCSSKDYEKVPDVALFDSAGWLKAIGELKTLWVRAHDLEAALRSRNEKSLRKLLAQPAKYMRDLDLRYGFVGTYNNAVFLRQVYSNGEWRLQYSPAIRHSTDTVKRTNPPHSWDGCVSLRECMFFLAQQVIADHRAVNNSVPWVVQ